MEPVNNDSIIAKFLKTRGEGLHHIALQVEDINETMEWMIRNSVRLINERPVLVDGFKAAFVHPASFGGVLIELIEGNPMWVGNTSLPEELQKTTEVEGIRAEGLLEVGIILQDLSAAESSYSKMFASEAVPGSFSFEAKVYKVGNVALSLTETTNQDGYLCSLLEKEQPGLNYIVLKVTDLASAISHLRKNEISFEESQPNNYCGSDFLFIHPKELSGIPVLLREKSR
jgi:4-hydroxyphenylpyruvate dioxygenase-like putative hemolysin